MIMVGGMQVVTKEGKERIEDEEVFLHTFLLQRKLLLCCAETEEISHDEATRTSRKSHFELREVRTFRAIAVI